MTVTTDAVDQELKVQADAEFPVNRGPDVASRGFTSGGCSTTRSACAACCLRGADGKLAPATWDEALGFIAERILTLQQAHGASSVVHLR